MQFKELQFEIIFALGLVNHMCVKCSAKIASNWSTFFSSKPKVAVKLLYARESRSFPADYNATNVNQNRNLSC